MGGSVYVINVIYLHSSLFSEQVEKCEMHLLGGMWNIVG